VAGRSPIISNNHVETVASDFDCKAMRRYWYDTMLMTRTLRLATDTPSRPIGDHCSTTLYDP